MGEKFRGWCDKKDHEAHGSLGMGLDWMARVSAL